jgi:hypothetical protein
MPDISSDPPIGGCFIGAVGGDSTVGGVTLVFDLCLFVWYMQAFTKYWLGATLSLPARASSGESPGRLLIQSALDAEPASMAGCQSDPWDASRQDVIPLAYPGDHPYESGLYSVYSNLNPCV